MRFTSEWNRTPPAGAVAFVMLVAVVVGGQSLFAQEDPADNAKADANVAKKAKLDFYRRQLRELRLFVDPSNKPCQFVEEPLTRWDNPISQNADGMMFLWTDRGRPVAMLNNHLHYPTKVWGRIFISLSERPLDMRSGEQPYWNPRQPAITFQPLDHAKVPADTAAARLVQLRNIAKEFQVDCHWGGKDKPDWRLRLLTTPLYRYQVPDEGVVDGALFGFIQSGPEAVLLLEARKTPQGLEWHYAASRSTSYFVRISRHDKTVVESPHLDGWKPTDPFFAIRVPIDDYPFDNPFADPKSTKQNSTKATQSEVQP
ncbi:MAG: hypothetical protein FD138_2070 [Planctomycetota bacterium]|nr:MAG: hypothetical protein FD138_2070 [Planctomycetota bacterium]